LKINLEREKNDHSQSKEETNQSSSSEWGPFTFATTVIVPNFTFQAPTTQLLFQSK
jgi:hypothetical protein